MCLVERDDSALSARSLAKETVVTVRERIIVSSEAGYEGWQCGKLQSSHCQS